MLEVNWHKTKVQAVPVKRTSLLSSQFRYNMLWWSKSGGS